MTPLLWIVPLCLLPVIVNFSTGFGENIDSYLIFNHAFQFHINGYIPSRSWGVPLYEWVAYPLINQFGTTVGKLYSVFWLTNSVILFFLSLKEILKNKKIVSLGTLAFGWLPCVIISGNTILETAQGGALGLYSLLFFLKFMKSTPQKANSHFLIASYLFAGLAAATRPPYVILIFAISVTLFVYRRSKLLLGICGGLLAIITATLPYVLLYHGNFSNPFSVHIFDTGDPLWMRVIKTGIGFAAILGIPLWLIVFYRLGKFFPNPVQKLKSIKYDYFDFFFGVLCILYLIRMLILPDELEYIYFWSIAFLLWFFRRIKDPTIAAIVVIAALLPNFVQIHFLERLQDGSLKQNIGLSHGVFEQENQKRALNEYIRVDFLEDAEIEAAKIGCRGFKVSPYDIFIERFPFHEDRDCVLTSLKWYARMRDVVLPSRGIAMEDFLETYDKKVLIHPLRRGRGWRRFIHFKRAFPVHSTEFLKL